MPEIMLSALFQYTALNVTCDKRNAEREKAQKFEKNLGGLVTVFCSKSDTCLIEIYHLFLLPILYYWNACEL